MSGERLIRQAGSAAVLVALLGLSGCASLGTYNPATERREMILISTPAEVSMGEDVHREIIKGIPLSTDQTKIARVTRVGERLARVSDRQDYSYHFFVLQKDELNAFTTPGGNIYIYTGLLDRLPGDDALAAVLAHEIGHCAARHTVKKYQAALGYNVAGQIVFGLFKNSQGRQLASMSSDAVMNLVFSAYSRQDEYQSDHLGLKYMRQAGFNQQGMVTTLQLLKQQSQDPGTLLILRSHPYLEDRIAAVQKEIGAQTR